MLVIISDLHMTDGTTGATTPAGAFQLFAEELRDMVFAASFRSEGGYRPVEGVDLVLLGDVLDVIRSARWLDGTSRPWDSLHTPQVAERIAQITSDILRINADGLKFLSRLSSEGGLCIPPANRQGQPVYQAEGQPVPVRTHYMVGNHDWFYHVRGADYDDVRRSLVRQLGLVNRPEAPFPHDPAESDALLDAMRRHKLLARHGDMYDPFNFEGDRDSSSLGDAIVLELITRFAQDVQRELGDDLPVATILGLREIDNIRPILLVPVWIDGLLDRTCPSLTVRKQVKIIWDRLADEFLALDFVRARDTWSPVDLVDGLQGLLKFSKRLSIGWAAQALTWLNRLRGPDDSSYYRHALAEQDFRNRRAKHIVYGHTHQPESVPLDASYAEGFVLNQMYFNSGTWRRLHRPTTLAPGEHEFIATDSLTYLAFFQGDERKGRPYETWTGMLGINPAEAPLYRVDVGAPRSAVPMPHFAVPGVTAPRGSAPIIPVRRM